MLVKKAAALEQEKSIDGLWRNIVETLAKVGFDHAVYLSISNDFKAGFVRTTMTRLYDNLSTRQDPFLVHACNSYEIVQIGAEFVDSHPYVSDQEHAFIMHAAKQGFRAGLGIPMRLQGAGRFGGFIVGTGLDRATFVDRMLPRAEEVRLFCLLMHRRLEELIEQPPLSQAEFRKPLLAPALPAALDTLSPREREVIYLLAQGSSRKEAAFICQISVHTVSEYTKAGYRKLGISNRAQAATLIYGEQSVP